MSTMIRHIIIIKSANIHYPNIIRRIVLVIPFLSKGNKFTTKVAIQITRLRIPIAMYPPEKAEVQGKSRNSITQTKLPGAFVYL